MATVRAVAVNAVMAGCPPPVFSVVVAAVRALLRPEVNLRGVQATTHPVAPVVIVHGEAVEALGFNAGHGTLGPGCVANATVGRAIRLVLLHIGGGYPGDGDASTQGGPAKYAYCFAENTAQSPWPSYHRSRGVDAVSAVTVHCGEDDWPHWEYPKPPLPLPPGPPPASAGTWVRNTSAVAAAAATAARRSRRVSMFPPCRH